MSSILNNWSFTLSFHKLIQNRTPSWDCVNAQRRKLQINFALNIVWTCANIALYQTIHGYRNQVFVVFMDHRDESRCWWMIDGNFKCFSCSVLSNRTYIGSRTVTIIPYVHCVTENCQGETLYDLFVMVCCIDL